MKKNRLVKTLLAASLLGTLVAASPAAADLSVAAATQSGQSAPQQGPAEFSRVRVMADDIARLPDGEFYVVEVSASRRGRAGGYTGGVTVSSGDVNAAAGAAAGGNNSGLTKTGTGTLTLSGANNTSANRVYEFRSDRPINFGRVLVRAAGTDAAPVPFEAWLRARMPAGAMRKWPFKHIVIGPARGVAQIKGWKADKAPGTNYECNGETCWCEGAYDCKPLIYSDKCAGELVCGDDDCFCEQGD